MARPTTERRLGDVLLDLLEGRLPWKRIGLTLCLVAYFLTCAGVVFSNLSFLESRDGDKFVAGAFGWVGRTWSPTQDTVLNFFIDVGLVVAAAALIWGILLTFVAVYVLGVAGLVLVKLFAPLAQGVWESPTGLIITVAVVGWGGHYVFLRRYREQTLRALELVLYAVGSMFGFVKPGRAAPVLGNEERPMPDEEKAAHPTTAEAMNTAKQQVDQAVMVLARATGLTLRTGKDYVTFFDEVRARVRMRSVQRSNHEILKLLDQAVEWNEKYLRLKQSQGELGRVDQESEVKDLELEARKLEAEIKKTKLAEDKRRLDAELGTLKGQGDGAGDDDPRMQQVAARIRELERDRTRWPDGHPERREMDKELVALSQFRSAIKRKGTLGADLLADPDLQRFLKANGFRVD